MDSGETIEADRAIICSQLLIGPACFVLFLWRIKHGDKGIAWISGEAFWVWAIPCLMGGLMGCFGLFRRYSAHGAKYVIITTTCGSAAAFASLYGLFHYAKEFDYETIFGRRMLALAAIALFGLSILFAGLKAMIRRSDSE